ncbi:MAG: sugar phosphate nucleotidyltransferase [Candidatus Gottesmanbacteria bacterium]
MNNELKVVLLAGGESTRFWPLTNKNEMVFLGKPFLSWHYEQLVRLGMEHVVVVTNDQNNERIRAIAAPKQLQVSYVIQKNKGQVQALVALENVCSGEVLLLNASDYYADAGLISFLSGLDKNHITLGAIKTENYFPGGYLIINADGVVLEIVEKPKKGEEPSDVVNILIDYIPDISLFITAAKKHVSNAASGYEDALNDLMKTSGTAHAKILDRNDWKPIKYPWNVLDVSELLLSEMQGSQIDKSVVIKENVIIEGPVIIEEGVKIFEGTKIVGPCYIGKNTIIGNNNIIRSSMIGNDCVTGFNTDITRSYVGNNCWFHSNYVGDSVLAGDISIGSGSVLANLRLDDRIISGVVKDEKISTERNKLGAMIGLHVRIGVNASIMPGVKIGSGSFIGAGVVLGKDVNNSQYCVSTSSYSVKDNTSVPAKNREKFRKGL